MSFDYDKIKGKHDEGATSALATYTDLFMTLSLIFLMMYVVASIKSGASSIQGQIEKGKLQRENEDLKAQLKAYNALKDSTLQDQTEEEQKNYDDLLNKLSLLQGEANQEKQQLRKQAMENEQKEQALNKYQQMVRNMVNSNMLAKAKLKTRENIIENKRETIKENEKTINQQQQNIAEQQQDINNLESEVEKQNQTIQQKQKQISGLNNQIRNQEQQIQNNNQELQNMNQELSKKISDLKRAEQNNQITRSQMNQKIEGLKRQAQQEAANLQAQNAAAQAKLDAMNNELSGASQKLSSMKDQMTGLQGQLQQEAAAKNQLGQELAAAGERAAREREAFGRQMANERAKFNNELEKAHLSAREKAQKLEEFNQQAKEREGEMGRKIASLSGDLQKAQEQLNARRKLADDIANNLKKAGVDADVNKQTGDVLISFGDDYFGAGSANLNPSMQKVLEKFMPKYAESLFKDKNIANKIGSVEIVGYASPTYAGKFVDPKSLKPEDKKAAKYNLDLSYKRARAIFDHVFDTEKLNFKNQEKLLPLVKVTGRSFFSDNEKIEGAYSGMSQKEFCKKFDCQKSQKVIIKFNLEDKPTEARE